MMTLNNYRATLVFFIIAGIVGIRAEDRIFAVFGSLQVPTTL